MCNSAMETDTFEEMELSCRVDEGAVLILGVGVVDLRYIPRDGGNEAKDL